MSTSIEILKPYTDPDSDKYKKMLEVMAQHLQLDSLKFQRLEDIVKAIGLPKEELCTHCCFCTGGRLAETKESEAYLCPGYRFGA